MSAFDNATLMTVSYTHLDVYKRQVPAHRLWDRPPHKRNEPVKAGA